VVWRAERQSETDTARAPRALAGGCAAGRVGAPEWTLLAATVVAGSVLRLRGLGDWALNPDEGIYRAVAAAPDLAAFARGLGEVAHPPLYFVLLRAWTLLGVAEDPAWLRLPAALLGVAGIAAIFALARRAFGAATACLAAAGWALAPGAVALSQLVRPYALLFVLLATGWWALLGFVERGRRRDLLLYTSAFGLALCTHYSAAIALAAAIGWQGLAVWRAAPRTAMRTRSRGLGAAQALLLGELLALTCFHLRPYQAAVSPLANMGWLAPFLPGTPVDAWLAFVGLHRFVFGPGPDGLATLLTVLGLAASLASASAGPRAFSMLAALALAIGALLAVVGLHPFGGTRHATWAFVWIVPLAAEGVRRMVSGPRPARIGGAIVLAVGLALPALPDALSGASRLRFGAQVERLATTEELAAFPLAGLRARSARLLLDEQAFYFLQPFFVDAAPRGGVEGELRVYDWGTARLVVARCWTLRAGRERTEAPDHVLGLARRAGAAPREGADGLAASVGTWLVSGGWAPLAAKALVARGLAEPVFDRPYGAVARLRTPATVSVR
jgi:hypothetical protein